MVIDNPIQTKKLSQIATLNEVIFIAGHVRTGNLSQRSKRISVYKKGAEGSGTLRGAGATVG
jgi:hypothetical protein